MGNDLATWLQEQIDRRGWKPVDLSREAKIAESTVSRILSGARGAGPDALKAIASALKVPDTVLLFRAGYLERDPQDPKQELDPVALEILQMLENRSDAEQEAALAALTALFEQFDRGKREDTGDRSGHVARARKA